VRAKILSEDSGPVRAAEWQKSRAIHGTVFSKDSEQWVVAKFHNSPAP